EKIYFTLDNVTRVPRNVVRYIQPLLRHRHSQVVIAAINILARSGARGVMGDIWEAGGRRGELVRVAVAEAAGDLEDRNHHADLIALVHDRSYLVRMFAIDSYARLFPNRARRELLRSMKKERHPTVVATI